MAFSNIENSEKLDIINVAVVDNEELKNNQTFSDAFNTLSDEENEDRLFNTKYVSEEDAKKLLENKEIDGYIILEEGKPKIVVSTSGINETIIKYVVEEIWQTGDIIQNIVENRFKEMIKSNVPREIENYDSLYANIYKDIAEMENNEDYKVNNISSSNLSYTMIEFYTLIAMTCLYGGILGMVGVNHNLPNMSNTGKRISASKTSKGTVIFSSLLASYLVQLIGLLLLFVYTIFVLKVDYGSNLPLIILLGLVGSFAGLSLGLAIGTLFKTNENIKTGIVISVTMLGCFLSGMMGITMKYIVDKNIPIINKINPASMITDGFYALYYYDTLDRYIFNIVSLCIFAAIMIIISYFSLRRQKYDSI